MKLQTMLLFLALSLCAAAQTMVGLPQYGVTLAGTGAAPQVVNHSGKTIVGVVLRNITTSGNGPVMRETFFLEDSPHDKLLDGQSMQTVGAIQFGVTPPAYQPGTPTSMMRTKTPLVQVELDLVIFADGTSVGPDATGSFADIAVDTLLMSKVAAEFAGNADRAAAAAALHAVGDSTSTSEMPAGTSSQARNARYAQASMAAELARQLGTYGDAAALKAAQKFAVLPQLVKK